MNKFKDLYKRFLNEEKLYDVSKTKPFRRVRFYWLMALAISFFPATILCSAGINEKWFSFPENLMYWFCVGFIVLYLLFELIFLIVSLKHQLFKKTIFPIIVALIPLFGIIAAFLMSFTGIPYVDTNGETEINIIIPIAYMFFIGFPAAMFYLFFCYYTFIGKLQELAAGLLRQEAKQYEELAKESQEELNKIMFENVTYKYHAHKYEKNKEKEQ